MHPCENDLLSNAGPDVVDCQVILPEEHAADVGVSTAKPQPYSVAHVTLDAASSKYVTLSSHERGHDTCCLLPKQGYRLSYVAIKSSGSPVLACHVYDRQAPPCTTNANTKNYPL